MIVNCFTNYEFLANESYNHIASIENDENEELIYGTSLSLALSQNLAYMS